MEWRRLRRQLWKAALKRLSWEGWLVGGFLFFFKASSKDLIQVFPKDEDFEWPSWPWFVPLLFVWSENPKIIKSRSPNSLRSSTKWLRAGTRLLLSVFPPLEHPYPSSSSSPSSSLQDGHRNGHCQHHTPNIQQGLLQAPRTWTMRILRLAAQKWGFRADPCAGLCSLTQSKARLSFWDVSQGKAAQSSQLPNPKSHPSIPVHWEIPGISFPSLPVLLWVCRSGDRYLYIYLKY